MGNLRLDIAEVREVENVDSPYIEDEKHETDKPYDGLRIRAKLANDKTNDNSVIPWAFPLLPKTIQSVPKIGESVLILREDGTENQRYYIGPIISQPQYFTRALKEYSTSLLQTKGSKPLERISDNDDTTGAFPKSSDIAIIGRGAEDIILRATYDSGKTSMVSESEIQLRAGIRCEPTNSDNPNMIGNIIFNGADPAYIQLKYKKGLSSGIEANSIINIVADRINLISNKDDNVSSNIHDKNGLIQNEMLSEVTHSLQAVPLGNNLYDLLMIMRGCILHHVHPWAGMEQCGDDGGYIQKLLDFNWSSILSKYVRTS